MMKSDPNHMEAEVSREGAGVCVYVGGVPIQIHRFTLNYQRRVYDFIQSCSIPKRKVNEAKTALCANGLKRLFDPRQQN